MAAPPNPPPVALPAPPNDPQVRLPPAPLYPPTRNDVLQAVWHHRSVDASINAFPEPGPEPEANCTLDDRYESVIYEHSVVAQAAAAAAPEAMVSPAVLNEIHQLHNEIHQVQVNLQKTRAEILPALKRLINQSRGQGNVVPFEVVPFTDGTDPTLPPYNLPHLHTVNVINNLSEQFLTTYLTHYGVVPLPIGENSVATNYLQKETLKQKVGAWE
ncbi:hypothetical protein EDB89DRAFT_2242905 [Lactarius sanguifluus]|nr:hypothetical protein EDB89DRAFT_2234454 [Lactarius sanguifluus]KAH9172454.1 hypothetical protein EDB89DRAFT_2242905 [Lactarius sanguifluus]